MGARPVGNRIWGAKLRSLGCSVARRRREGVRYAVWHGIGLLGAESGRDGRDDDAFSGESYTKEFTGTFPETTPSSRPSVHLGTKEELSQSELHYLSMAETRGADGS